MGTTDEFGPDYDESEVFISKNKPFNFNLTPPTPNIFIDPILLAHVEGLRYALENEFSPGIHLLSKTIDRKIVQDFEFANNFDTSDLEKYFS